MALCYRPSKPGGLKNQRSGTRHARPAGCASRRDTEEDHACRSRAGRYSVYGAQAEMPEKADAAAALADQTGCVRQQWRRRWQRSTGSRSAADPRLRARTRCASSSATRKGSPNSQAMAGAQARYETRVRVSRRRCYCRKPGTQRASHVRCSVFERQAGKKLWATDMANCGLQQMLM